MNIRNIILMTMLQMVFYLIPDQGKAQSSRNSYSSSSRNSYGSSSRRTNNYQTQLPSYSSSNSFSQRGGPGGNPDVPIDGGISLLLAAGAAYGAKKVHTARKGKKTNQVD